MKLRNIGLAVLGLAVFTGPAQAATIGSFLFGSSSSAGTKLVLNGLGNFSVITPVTFQYDSTGAGALGLTFNGGFVAGTGYDAVLTLSGSLVGGGAIFGPNTLQAASISSVSIASGADVFLAYGPSSGLIAGGTGGSAASLLGSEPADAVSFTSNVANLPSLINRAYAFSLTDLSPAFGLIAGNGSNLKAFSSNISGTFSADLKPNTEVPEPGAVALGAAMFLGSGLLASRRRRK